MSETERVPSDEQSESERLDIAVDQAIAACDGDLRSTIRSLLLVIEYLEYELETKGLAGIRPRRTPRQVEHLLWLTSA